MYKLSNSIFSGQWNTKDLDPGNKLTYLSVYIRLQNTDFPLYSQGSHRTAKLARPEGTALKGGK